jgi:hypothetical protein
MEAEFLLHVTNRAALEMAFAYFPSRLPIKTKLPAQVGDDPSPRLELAEFRKLSSVDSHMELMCILIYTSPPLHLHLFAARSHSVGLTVTKCTWSMHRRMACLHPTSYQSMECSFAGFEHNKTLGVPILTQYAHKSHLVAIHNPILCSTLLASPALVTMLVLNNVHDP